MSHIQDPEADVDPFSDLRMPWEADEPFTPTTLVEESAMPIAALYGRVSTDIQDIRTQRAWGERHARNFGFRLPESTVFLDEDQSGRTPLQERRAGGRLWGIIHGPGIQLEPGGGTLPVKTVLVSAFDRWGRDPDDAIRNLKLCHNAGVKIYFADVPLYDPEDPMSMLVIRMRSIIAEFEVAVLRKRIRDKFRQKRVRRELCGHPAYGFRRVEREGVAYEEPDEEQQKWLGYMLQRRNEGWGYEKIATDLTRKGAPHRTQWGPGSVRNIILTAERRAQRESAEQAREEAGS